jgi:hypothetical protein
MNAMDYAALVALNPVGRIKQWVYTGYDDDDPKDRQFLPLLEKLQHTHTEYTSASSLIARVPFKSVGLVVYLSLSSDGNQLASQGWADVDMLLVHQQLSDIPTIACNGDKCRRKLSFAEHGIWCTSCHGDPDYNVYVLFHHLTHYDTSFDQIPLSAILAVHGQVDAKAIHHMTTDQHQTKVNSLRERIASLEDRLSQLKRELALEMAKQ